MATKPVMVRPSDDWELITSNLEKLQKEQNGVKPLHQRIKLYLFSNIRQYDQYGQPKKGYDKYNRPIW